MATVFDDLLLRGVRSGEAPGRTQASRDWFRQQARQSRGARPTEISRDRDRLVNRAGIGRMYFFFYDPKTKADLPYYDTFPLIFKVANTKGGFYGINLHYLPYKLRAKLMDSLYEISSNSRYDDTTKLNLSYRLLNSASKYRYFKPTFKKYLNKHVRSRFVEINPSEWDIALFLPVERFEKASKSQVWADSRNMIT
jgi:hypothetical protein